MKISVIIPAHNEEAYIGATLEALKHQTCRNYEVIVVANGCRDRTIEIVQEAEGVRLVDLPQKGLSRSRNEGARVATGDLLVFLDADTLLEASSLEIIARHFQPGSSTGTVRGQPDSKRFIFKLFYLFKNSIHRLSLHQGSSGVILCWKKEFDEVGGFDTALHVRENSDLNKRLSRFGSYAYIGQTTATTSMRRYDGGKRLKKALLLWIKLWFSSIFSSVRHKRYTTVR